MLTRYMPAVLLGLFGCSQTALTHGIPNFHQVDDRVYRSGQVSTVDGWMYVKSLGVTDILKLNFESEGNDELATAIGITVHELSIQPEGGQDVWDDVAGTFLLPDRSKLAEAQALLAMPGKKWLVHCEHGEDRTGRTIGEYRVRIGGWTKDRAFREAIALGYHLELLGLLRSWEWVP